MDWYWARKLFVYRSTSGKTTEYPSSTWSSTSRSRWSDWILEIKGLSSERFCAIWTLFDEMWKSTMARRRRQQEKISILSTDSSGQEILYLDDLQSHSGRNPIDPSLQDNVIIPNNFFEYTYHIGCSINLHSITNSGLIPGGQNLSKRQTVFLTSVDPMNKEHRRDPNKIDLEAPRLVWYHQKNVEETSKHGVLGRDQTCSKERI